VQRHDVSMFEISNIKLYSEDVLSCKDHSAGSKPILNMDSSSIDNIVSSDHIQLIQSYPQVQHDSSDVSLDPILNNTQIDEVDLVVHSEIDSCLHEATSTLHRVYYTVQYSLPPRSNRGQPPVRYDPNFNPKLNISLVITCHLTSYLCHMQRHVTKTHSSPDCHIQHN